MPLGDIVEVLGALAEGGGPLFVNIFRYPGALVLRIFHRGSNLKHILREGNVFDQIILGLLFYGVLALFIIWLVA